MRTVGILCVLGVFDPEDEEEVAKAAEPGGEVRGLGFGDCLGRWGGVVSRRLERRRRCGDPLFWFVLRLPGCGDFGRLPENRGASGLGVARGVA